MCRISYIRTEPLLNATPKECPLLCTSTQLPLPENVRVKNKKKKKTLTLALLASTYSKHKLQLPMVTFEM